jgi:RNA polymerase sigma-70 factor (ECF subfamily)
MDERARALEELYRRRYVAFRNALATVTGSYETARDAVQEAFARALRNRRDLRQDRSLEAWVWRIALRTAFELRGKVNEAPLNGSLNPALVEPECDAELAEALRALPPRRRLVVFLHYFADLSYGEIAEVCGIREGTVAATLAQAREQLGQELLLKERVDG